MSTSTLVQRITNYLAAGGLTNPEHANHDMVRDLLIDCRAALTPVSCCQHSPGDHFVAPDGWTVCNRCSCVRRPEVTFPNIDWDSGNLPGGTR